MNQFSKQSMEILKESRQFSFLLQKAQRLTDTGSLLQGLLPAPLNEHITVANTHHNTLILEVESAVWATQLRFYIPELLKKLQLIPEMSFLKEVSFYVRPGEREIPPLEKKGPMMSLRSADLLREIADSIEDPALKEAMRKLANHGE